MSFTSVINLSSLNGSNGLRIEGKVAFAQFGAAVSNAGDVNGDGYADIIVGAPNETADQAASGASYVIFGSSAGFPASINVSALNGTQGFRIDGIQTVDYAGSGVTSAGDLNGDGYADLLISAPGHGTEDADYSNFLGEAYVVFGHSGAFTPVLKLSSLNGSNGFRVTGQEVGELVGVGVASPGDINGDGLADILISAGGARVGTDYALGAVYVIYGRSTGFPSLFDPNSLNGRNGFIVTGTPGGAAPSGGIASAGDVNGDGFADFMVTRSSDGGSGDRSGSVYVVFGGSSGLPSRLPLDTLSGPNGFRIDGPSANANIGAAIAAAGDVNGDGYGDLLLGGGSSTINGVTQPGFTYVVFGKSSGFTSALNLSAINGTNGFLIREAADKGVFGAAVGAAGDVNGDGFADFLVGAPLADIGNRYDAGSAYLFFGRSGGFPAELLLSSLQAADGVRLDGASFSSKIGLSVAGAGDIDSDGFADIIIGASEVGYSGRQGAGAAYVYLSPATGGAFERGTSLADRLLGTPDADTINGYGQRDLLLGAAGNDTINGGAGDDTIDGGADTDTALFSGTQSQYRIGLRDSLTIVTGPDGTDRLFNVEFLKFGSAAAVATSSLRGSPSDTGLFLVWTGGVTDYVQGQAYTGPVAGLVNQMQGGPNPDVILGSTANDFINGGGGDDAINGGAGNDVIDGGLGSNFLSGGTGVDQFFIDGRGAGAVTWSTITDWQPGEAVTIWGYRPGVSKFLWVANDGTAGFKGVTLHSDLDGNGVIDTSLTWTGVTQAQLPTPSYNTDYVYFA